MPATVERAHTLGLRVVDEGVEDDSLGLLRGLRCDLVRGYVMSKRRPANELELTRWPIPLAAHQRRAA